MAEAPLDIARLSGAAVSDDGSEVRFRIESADGRAVEVTCDHARLEPLVHYIAQLGQLSATQRGGVAPHSFGATDKVTVSPIETSDVGFMRGMESDEVVLVVRMFGFDLGFAVTPAQLRALHGEIERIMPRSSLQPSDHHHHDHGHHHHHHHGHGEDGD